MTCFVKITAGLPLSDYWITIFLSLLDFVKLEILLKKDVVTHLYYSFKRRDGLFLFLLNLDLYLKNT